MNEAEYDVKNLIMQIEEEHRRTGRGARGAAAPPDFGQVRFFGQQEKIWAKPVFKDVAMFI